MEEGTEKHRRYHCSDTNQAGDSGGSESWSKKRERRRKSGSGKKVSSRTLSVKANGIEATSASKVGVRKALQGLRGYRLLSARKSWKVAKLVVGQWYSWTMMKRPGPCMGCTAQWRRILRSSVPSRGRSGRPSHAFFDRVMGLIKVYVDIEGIIDGLRRGERVHQAKSGRCRFMDQNLGRTALSGRKGIWWKWNM